MCVQSTLYKSLEKIESLAHASNLVAPDWIEPRTKKSGAAWIVHIPDDGAALSPYVEVFREGTNEGYAFMDAATTITAVVSVAMPNCNKEVSDSPCDAHPDQEQYLNQLQRKWR